MKLIISIVFLISLNNAYSQSLFGINHQGSDVYFASLEIESGTVNNISLLPNVSSTTAAITFDSRAYRYAIITNLGITIVNALDGSIIKAIPQPPRMTGIEFGPNNNLYGVMFDGSDWLFVSLDIETESLVTYGIIQNVSSIQSTAAFDEIDNRYFLSTNIGIVVIDATDGSIIKVISNPNRMAYLQYSCRDELFGIYRTGSDFIIASVNIESEVFDEISVLTNVQSIQNSKSYDVVNDRYVIKTNLGVTIVSMIDGSIIQTINVPNNSFSGLKFEGTCRTLIDSCGSYPWEDN